MRVTWTYKIGRKMNQLTIKNHACYWGRWKLYSGTWYCSGIWFGCFRQWIEQLAFKGTRVKSSISLTRHLLVEPFIIFWNATQVSTLGQKSLLYFFFCRWRDHETHCWRIIIKNKTERTDKIRWLCMIS